MSEAQKEQARQTLPRRIVHASKIIDPVKRRRAMDKLRGEAHQLGAKQMVAQS